MVLDWHDRYRPRREVDRTLRQMTPDDIPASVALAERVGWRHQARDWARLLAWSPDGCFLIEEAGGRITGTVSTTPYGTELAWIGTLVVAPDRQRHGLGRQLMRAALDYLITKGTERIMLDATDVARPLYRSLGFREVCKIERWEGRASTYLGQRAQCLHSDDVPAILDLDAPWFGVSRTHILIRLLEEFPDLAWVDYQGRKLEGYLLGRQTKNGVHLGPWMSWSAASGERLLLAALEQLQGQPVALDTPDYNGRGQILASDHNLRRAHQRTRMVYGSGEPVLGQPLAQLAIASLATG
ncbi:MAG TPA: GNAT family N-acetyltransferase [Aggregatilineaceae bacterium]|jgi:GNAT superfamily N-acetyltransferase|nr:GNAT family N-acetyltransferase [Aggregatilineaceae bacterium]